jgi:putative membrane protein
MQPSLTRNTALSFVLGASLGIGGLGLAVHPAYAAGHHKLNDAQIAAVVVGADTIDINYGELALKKSHDPAVRQFAQQMVRDHSAINKAAEQLVNRLGV